MSRIALLVLLTALAPASLEAQGDPVLESRAEIRAASAAYAKRDWNAYLAHATRAQALRPEHGGVTLALASARAVNGDTAGAVAALRGYAARGYTADIAADSDFAVVRASPDWPALAGRLARNAEPIVRSAPALTIADRGLLAEGIAYDPATRTFYVASVRQRKILQVGPDGGATVLADSTAGLWAPMGMRATRRADVSGSPPRRSPRCSATHPETVGTARSSRSTSAPGHRAPASRFRRTAPRTSWGT